jgi:predicted metal-binding transcription factor (methanogenesis marker protein 9)
MEEQEITKTVITTPDGRVLTLVYSLISQQRCFALHSPEQENGTCYGVSVACTETDDKCTVQDITLSREKIMEFIALISRWAVTPATVRDIVDDMLGISL